MRLLLASHILLRGWDLLPYAYINTLTGAVTFISENDMNFLTKCNGLCDFGDDNKLIEYYLKNGIIEIREGVIRDEQIYKKIPTRFFKQAHWAITNNCNFKCKHCFISAPHFYGEDISLESCYKIIDELHSSGIYKLSLTGGEPLIRKDFISLLKYTKTKNITITDINSNGSLFTEKFVTELKHIGINPVFNISYDGKNTHNWIRGATNAEELTLKGIELLKTNGFKVSISYCLYQDNLNTIIDNLDFLSDLGVDSVKFGLINSVGEWTNAKFRKSVSAKEILEMLKSIIPTLITKRYPIDINLAGFLLLFSACSSYTMPMVKDYRERALLNKWVCCETMRNTLCINPQGKLIGCEMLTDTSITDNFPNILETSLKKILKSGTPFMAFIDKRLVELENAKQRCPSCSFYNVCHAGCRANANFNGNYLGIDPVACCYFMNGYYKDIKEFMELSQIPVHSI